MIHVQSTVSLHASIPLIRNRLCVIYVGPALCVKAAWAVAPRTQLALLGCPFH